MLGLAALLIAVILGLLAYLDTRKPKKFPPGPKWLPLIGSALQVQEARSRLGSLFEATAELSLKYGPILGLKIGKDPLIVVCGPQEIKEMSVSEDFLGRPTGSFFEMRTWNKRRGIILTDNEFWQEQRRFLVRQLREFGFGTRNMSLLVEEEVSHLIVFINKALENGRGSCVFNMESLFSVSVLNTLWKMMAGVRYSPEDQKMITLQSILADLFKTIHMVGASFSHFPVLKYIAPQMSGYKCYMDTHIQIWEFLRNELEHHKKTHNPKEPRDLMDVYLNMLQSPEHGSSFSEEQLLAICMDMFMAGSETTNNTMSFCFLYLILNPRVQKKAQDEIDAVLGNRAPCLNDRSKMPYMEAIVLEALRMFGCRAFAVPHRAVKDTYLGGYLIPKDILVTANLYGCMMGPHSGFDNPEQFIPERYLKDGKVVIPENLVPFGLGKRRCMGEPLARANVFLFTTSILQKFDIHMLPEYPPDMKIVDGVTPAPLHYKAKITHRKCT
ncbi:probable cytochrome P450 303a1 isoform X2 [Anthonomus grandis grandis]|nr:probable cytochrome P450 303a1 isoform X2 [Anthonomus grandis grandis]